MEADATHLASSSDYNQHHHIPEEIKKEMAEFLYHNLDIGNKKSVKILDAGVGNGDNIFLPLVKKILDDSSCTEIELYGIDLLKEQLQNLKTSFNTLIAKYTSDCCFEIVLDNENPEMLVTNVKRRVVLKLKTIDINSELDFFESNKGKFNIIIATYSLQHLINWREASLKILWTLSDGGSFIVGERLGINPLLDGFTNRYSCEVDDENAKQVQKFLEEYIEMKCFMWSPEISATDMKNVCDFVTPFFGEPNNVVTEFIYTNKECKFINLKEWLRKPVFRYLATGPKLGEYKLEGLFSRFSAIPDDYEFYKDGHKLKIMKGFKPFTTEQFNYWMTKPIIRKITNLNKSSVEELCTAYCDLLAQNDMYLSSTQFISLHQWDILNNTWNDTIRLQINSGCFASEEEEKEFVRDYLRYMIFLTEIDYSFNTLIFRDDSELKRLKISFGSDDKLKIEQEKEEITHIKIPRDIRSSLTLNPDQSDETELNKKIDAYFAESTYNNSSRIRSIKIDASISRIKSGTVSSLTTTEKFNEFQSDFYKTIKDSLDFSKNLTEENKMKVAQILLAQVTYFLKDERLELFYEPSKVLKEANGKLVGFGGIIKLEKIPGGDLELEKITRTLISQRNFLLYQLTNILFTKVGVISWAEKQRADLILHSSRSAVAAIMGRNMSHNIGSHVIAYLKSFTRKLIDDMNGDKKTTLPDSPIIAGYAWFLNYLQERQDYIASISGFENQTFLPVNFKSFVFDGFLPDHKFLRHQDGSTNIENCRNYLLDYICLSENITRDKIKTFFRDFDSADRNHTGKVQDSFTILSQLTISLPGGILGRQAIFSILENFIRNSAKHYPGAIPEELHIKLDAPDIFSGNNVIDNRAFQYDCTEFIKITLSDNLKTYNEAHAVIKEGIDDELIDPKDGKLNPKFKGIKEMKISAAWLRGISPECVDNDHNPPLLTVSDNQGSIEYTFYLLKPKELLIILPQGLIDKLNCVQQELAKYGVELLTLAQANSQDSLRHSITVIENGSNNSELEKLKGRLNQRVLFLSKNLICENLFPEGKQETKIDQSYVDKILGNFWTIWLKSRLGSNFTFPPIYISDQLQPQIHTDYPEKYLARTDTSEDIQVLFRQHNDTLNNFKVFRKTFNGFNNIDFLEGISGGNSTDLFLRNLPKTQVHYLKLLESSFSKILIIDERLYNSVSIDSLSEVKGQWIVSQSDISAALERGRNLDAARWGSVFIEYKLISEDEVVHFTEKYYIHRNNLAKIISYFKTKNRFKEKTDHVYEEENIQVFYNKKRIQLVNCIFDKNTKTVRFYNIMKQEVMIFKNSAFQCSFENLLPDAICIHQGIVDKIHATTNIGIALIFEVLKSSFPNAILIVHSGRSKPTNDLPKGVYFLPFASLEVAFNDCKHTLSELILNVKGEYVE